MQHREPNHDGHDELPRARCSSRDGSLHTRSESTELANKGKRRKESGPRPSLTSARARTAVIRRYLMPWIGWVLASLLLLDRYSGSGMTCYAGFGGTRVTARAGGGGVVVVAPGSAAGGEAVVAADMVVRPADLPHWDMLLVIFTADNEAGAEKRATMREIYGKYNGVVLENAKQGQRSRQFTLHVVFLVASAHTPRCRFAAVIVFPLPSFLVLAPQRPRQFTLHVVFLVASVEAPDDRPRQFTLHVVFLVASVEAPDDGRLLLSQFTLHVVFLVASMLTSHCRFAICHRSLLQRPRQFTLHVVFLVASVEAPDDGRLDGDVFWVRAPPGYNNIAEMTKQMMALHFLFRFLSKINGDTFVCLRRLVTLLAVQHFSFRFLSQSDDDTLVCLRRLVQHFSFRFLLKSDDDTFVCLRRLVTLLAAQTQATQRRLYAGVPTACGVHRNNPNVGRVIMDKTNRWYDPKFVTHTMGGLPCYPVYMQGAFYVLAQPLVEFLNLGRPHWVTFQNEDVTVGSWLLGVDRDIVTIDDITTARLWGCQCSLDTMPQWARKSSVFFHDCKALEKLRRCDERFRAQVGTC
ncbi:hypothetical protein JKP88DRAFT_322373 [Tribonema minus]|uniref:Hexosyltransferase n=1 Tax=Tribonema minus TaxID=303371 RepID=A0A835YTA1_9STRA|nr:hypothetical protein JKP88DRAFT_322373 [Tribonema minus]